MQKIKVLEEIEHIRLRKGMYIGEGKDVTHLIEEVLDNALDEVANGYGTSVGLVIDTKTPTYTILDNGRGLPIYKEKTTNMEIPIVLCSKLFSGGKFTKDNYKVSVGLNGVGLVVVNALSEYMQIIINHYYEDVKDYVDKKYKHKDDEYLQIIYYFEDSKFKSKNITIEKGGKPFSTAITFKPNKEFFDSLTYDEDFIYNRLHIASVFTNAKILYQVDGKQNIIDINLEDYFKNTFLHNTKNHTKLLHYFDINKKTNEGIDLILSYDLDSDDYNFSSSVNLLPVSSGNHINYLNLELQNMFQDFANKYNYNFNKYDCMVGLKYYFNIYLLQTDFSSQTKDKLTTNKKHFEHIFEPIIKKLKKDLENNETLLIELLNKFQSYRDRLKGKKVNKNLISNGMNRGITSKDSKLRDCQSKNISETELFICEGDSAAGSLIQSRDPKYHAILGLRGKVINVSNNDIDKILKNNEIVDIIKSIGIGMKSSPKDKLQMDKIRYGKIILLADADPDGGHIMALLMAAFAKFVPDLIQQGFLYICIPPLYALTNGKITKYFWNINDLNEYMNNNNTNNFRLIRYKGLGEMNPDEMHECAINKKTRKLIQLQFPENPQDLIDYLVSSDKKRELLNTQEGV